MRKEWKMNDRLLKESDVLRIAFQLPLVVNSAFADAVKALPSADKPQKIIAQIIFDEEKLREIVKEAVERFKEEYEVIDRPQGERIINWDDRYRKCTNCNQIWWFDYGSYNSDFCPNCGARMKEVDDEKPM